MILPRGVKKVKDLKFNTIIFNSLKYIEENINEPIMVKDISKNAGSLTATDF